jgi:hypothetical protein
MPLAWTTPLAYGFAAHLSREDAIKAAANEAVQRLGFLLGEPIPQAVPSFSPTPDFHQEFFLFPPSHELLRRWLEGNPDASGSQGGTAVDDGRRHRDDEVLFVDITPNHLRGSVFVTKALCSSAEPLVFGEPAPHRANTGEARRVHPIA